VTGSVRYPVSARSFLALTLLIFPRTVWAWQLLSANIGRTVAVHIEPANVYQTSTPEADQTKPKKKRRHRERKPQPKQGQKDETPAGTAPDGPPQPASKPAPAPEPPPPVNTPSPGAPAVTPSGGAAKGGAPQPQKPAPAPEPPPPAKTPRPGEPGGGFAGNEPPPKFELSFSYNYARLASSNCQGGSAAIAYNATDDIALVGDVSVCNQAGLPSGLGGNSVMVLAGPRLNLSSGDRWRPYLQVLIGEAHSNLKGSIAGNSFATTVGGGFDVGLSSFMSFKVFQAEYLLTRFGDIRQNGFRFQSGIVLRFRSR